MTEKEQLDKINEAHTKIRSRLEKDGHKLLYLTQFGSHLYGLNTETSDLDLLGIFLPSKESCVLGNQPKSFIMDTSSGDEKNTAEDVDCKVISLQKFMRDVAAGEVNALDLLFSHTHKECIVFQDTIMNHVFGDTEKLFNRSQCGAYRGYAMGQVMRYGVKSSRLGVLKDILIWMQENIECPDSDYPDNIKLGDFAERLAESCGDKSHCLIKEVNGANKQKENALIVIGKVNLFSISGAAFYKRIKDYFEKYGDRVKSAEANECIDWKCVMHAARAIAQMRMLLKIGYIKFPLEEKDVVDLLKIKKGEIEWKVAEKVIVDGIDEVEELLKKDIPNTYNNKYVKSVILSCYS